MDSTMSDTSKTRGRKSPAKMQIRDFSQSLPMALLRARESVMRHFRSSLRMHELTEQQWRILRALAAAGEIEVTELARVAFLLGPSLSRILRDLEGRKLIERHVLENDLRRNVVGITQKGVRLMASVAPASEQIYREMTKRFGAKKLADLQAALYELEACLMAMPVRSAGQDDEAAY